MRTADSCQQRLLWINERGFTPRGHGLGQRLDANQDTRGPQHASAHSSRGQTGTDNLCLGIVGIPVE